MKLLVVGGGIIGMSIAYEMVQRGHQVVVVERESIGRKASYAGAGILVPGNERTALHPIEWLFARSCQLHAEWAAQLKSETGIDNGYHVCGALHLARTPGDLAGLAGAKEEFQIHKIRHQELTFQEAIRNAPCLAEIKDQHPPRKFVWLPDEAQFCNPAHMQALLLACRKRGVIVLENVPDIQLDWMGDHVALHRPEMDVDMVCIAAGAWSGQVLERLGIALPMVPVRGQIVLFQLDQPPFECVIYEGSRYLVPRRDGHVLAGATIEEAGFNEDIQQESIAELKRFASRIAPQLSDANAIKSWAGLRPATFDGMPYIGQCGTNLFVASGHFKSGLQLSTATAVVLADQMEEKPPPVDLAPFHPLRMDQSSTSS